jgi:hypothetical protein
MKTVATASGICALTFVVISFQMGSFRVRQHTSAKGTPPSANATFPDDLAPAAQAKAVAAARDFKPGPKPHRLVFLRVNGTVHPWQETLRVNWKAETVSTTELVVVVGKQQQTDVSNASTSVPMKVPTAARVQYDLEISVIEAKTGRILANRLFRNVPRPATAIGRAVSVEQVFDWVSRMSQSGFPASHDPAPIVTQVD